MAQKSSFDMNKLTSADKILLVAGALFLLDTFLAWQRVCVSDIAGIPIPVGLNRCGSASAWGGSASIFGILAAVFAVALVAWNVLAAVGADLNLGMPASTVGSILVGGTFGFGLLKFLFSAFNHGAFGAWIGLILLIAIGYGGYMKMQEPKPHVAPPAAEGSGA